MIEHVYQLGAATPQIGSPPTRTTAAVRSLDTTTDTLSGGHAKDVRAVLDTAEHTKAAQPPPNYHHHEEREEHT
ncbi:hypothetical protein ABTX85_11165 [Streptomyces sp. NPDC096097]|uniref:hypothetical protein n=1 Tax=Streptomyces sp. NPDC096097 TaxID=3155546 RepID=UPI003316C19D